MTRIITIATCLLAIAATLGPAAAQSQTALLGNFRDWTAATMQVDGKVCLAYTQPRESEPEQLDRDPVILYVTRLPEGEGKTEVSVKIGYTFQEKSTPTASVGNKTFEMFARKDTAWLANIEDDPRMIEAMREGAELTIRATSSSGTETTDTFSLYGMTAALERALEACK